MVRLKVPIYVVCYCRRRLIDEQEVLEGDKNCEYCHGSGTIEVDEKGNYIRAIR